MNTLPQIQEIMPLIQKEAWKCFRKLKQPTFFTVEDLIQEGTIAYLQKCDDYDADRNEFIPFILMCIRSHFAAIVQKSYRTIDKISEDISSMSIAAKNTFADIAGVVENIHTLTKIEREYLLYMFQPPIIVQTKLKNIKNSRKKRIYIRELLGISNEKERKIRANIFTLFQNRK